MSVCQELVLGVGNRVKIVMWTKGPRQESLPGLAASPVRLTPNVGLAWQLSLFSEMCMGKELGSEVEVF